MFWHLVLSAALHRELRLRRLRGELRVDGRNRTTLGLLLMDNQRVGARRVECGLSEACLMREKPLHAQEKFEEFAPPVLFLHLGRGQRNRQTGEQWKVTATIDVPFTLVWAERTYHLCGVVQHIGEHLNHGHYVSAVRSERGAPWLHCDDGSVRGVGDADVSAMEAYLLVYLREETAEMPLLARARAFGRPAQDDEYVEAFANAWRKLGDASMVRIPEPRPIVVYDGDGAVDV